MPKETRVKVECKKDNTERAGKLKATQQGRLCFLTADDASRLGLVCGAIDAGTRLLL